MAVVRVPRPEPVRATPDRIPVQRPWAAELPAVPGLLGRLDAAAKRVLDVAVAATLLVVLSPLLAVLAVVVRRDSPGPALFRQERAGQHGRPFTCLKLRSMRVDADQRLHATYMAERIRAGLPLLKMDGDPRITRLGKLLRTTSLDELPQLWNVLRGDMSLVGPRPALAYELELYDAQQQRRLLVKPGITGLAQIHSRGKGTLAEYIQYDLEYVSRRSFWLDVSIIVRTIPAVLGARGAG
jgi:lipopolysaccharide/colanic/teichoic acid biosynthesis glycosyltransferase